MNDDPFEGLIGSRRDPQPSTGWWIRWLARRPIETSEPGGAEYMLLQDLRTYSLPHGRGLDDGFEISLGSSDKTASKLVLDALPARYYRQGLEESFRYYVENALWFLAQGDLYLQIEYFRNSQDTDGPPVAFRLDFLHPGRVSRRFGKYSHLVPTGDGGDDAQWSREYLDPTTLVVVSLPRRLRRTLDRTLRVLRASDHDFRVATDFTLGKNGQNSGFDLSTYRRLSHDLILRASRKTGWAGRGIFTEGMLDPAKAWRALQFARFGIELRNIALRGLQEALDRAGAELGFEVHLTLSGVLTFEHVDRLEADLFAGTRPMGEMFIPKVPS